MPCSGVGILIINNIRTELESYVKYHIKKSLVRSLQDPYQSTNKRDP